MNLWKKRLFLRKQLLWHRDQLSKKTMMMTTTKMQELLSPVHITQLTMQILMWQVKSRNSSSISLDISLKQRNSIPNCDLSFLITTLLSVKSMPTLKCQDQMLKKKFLDLIFSYIFRIFFIFLNWKMTNK